MELNIVWLKLFSVLNHTSFWTTDGANLFTDCFVMFFKITDLLSVILKNITKLYYTVFNSFSLVRPTI